MADDHDFTDDQLADLIGPYIPRSKPVPHPPNTCPACEATLDPSAAQDVGGWNGCSASGAIASGPILAITCPACSVELRCYYNVWDDDGNIKPDEAPVEFVWGKHNSDG